VLGPDPQGAQSIHQPLQAVAGHDHRLHAAITDDDVGGGAVVGERSQRDVGGSGCSCWACDRSAAPGLRGGPGRPSGHRRGRTISALPGYRLELEPRPTTFEGNFNTCATLSTMLVTVGSATGSSPVAALMFQQRKLSRDGDVEGLRGFISLDAAQTTGRHDGPDLQDPGLPLPSSSTPSPVRNRQLQ
jgi:hypothetical protein